MPRPVLLLILAACTAPTEAIDSAAPTPPPPACEEELVVTHGEGGCFGSPVEWEFKADLAGCADRAVLSMWRTDGEPRGEQHPMVLHGEGPDRVWQAWFLGPLPHDTADWVPAESTAFDCDLDGSRVTFAVQMYDAAGEMRACATWGHAPDRVVAGDVPSLGSGDAEGFSDCIIRPW